MDRDSVVAEVAASLRIEGFVVTDEDLELFRAVSCGEMSVSDAVLQVEVGCIR